MPGAAARPRLGILQGRCGDAGHRRAGAAPGARGARRRGAAALPLSPRGRAHERIGGSARPRRACGDHRQLAWPPWRPLRGLKILLPFAALVAVWWAIYASGDFSPQVLVSPLAVWRAFVHLVTPWRDGGIRQHQPAHDRRSPPLLSLLDRRADRLRGRRQPLCGARAGRLPALPAGHFRHRLAAARHHLVRLHPHHDAGDRHLHADRADHLQHHDRRARDPGELHAGAALARRLRGCGW